MTKECEKSDCHCAESHRHKLIAESLGKELADTKLKLEHRTRCLRNANGLICAQAEESQKIVETLQAELSEAKKEIERLKVYSEYPFGCDNSEHMADEILFLKSMLAERSKP